MLDFIKGIIYGIVEGITEWLPISSTGHLLLLEDYLPFENVSDGFFEMFEVVIQLGAILAVVVLFFSQIWPFALTRKERSGKKSGVGSWIKWDIIQLWFKILVSCVPAAIIGVLFDEQLDALFYNPISVAIALIVFGIAFIVIESYHKGKHPKIESFSELTFQMAIWIGVFQVIAAVFPGTSRSGATIIGALLLGVSRTVAAQYTFYLAIPVMFGASLLKIVKFGFDFAGIEVLVLATGTIVAFLISIISLRFLMNYVKRHDFKVFGWYRIALGALVIALTFLP
ncbi:MAG: undecaprenyl-diphosphate phosphatase [Lachnospiraceae bacterium]|jgi:undecaprenyl-diphosphatase|nr:undecaprenyl-diphosphate phosphatase [Lachnospiraceae bacterium]